MKKNVLLLLLLMSCSVYVLHAQRKDNARQCRASEVNEELFIQNPQSRKEFQNFNDFTQNFTKIKGLGQKAGETYVIPVVFHVYGTTQNGKTVTQQKIKTALDVLNKDFIGQNDDWNTIDPYFDSRKAALSIRFALAQKDPNGNNTTGVIFYNQASGMGNYSSPIVARDGWDNYKYMNVYITADLYGDGSPYNSGVAWYPNTSMSNQGIARVVYNGQYIHGNTSKEFASVLTHEFGHFFNLIHTHEGGCGGTDQVSDTPQDSTSSGSGDCNETVDCGQRINYENYMGYNSSQGCAKMYTRGQVDRMLAALQHPARKPLWQESNLIATGVLDGGTNPPSAYCNANGDTAYEYIQRVQIENFNNSTTGSSGGYGDYTSQTINLTPGSTASVTLTPGFVSGSYNEYWGIWIDYNKNQQFETSERVLSQSGNSVISGNITIPSGLSGNTRLRVAIKYNSDPFSCGNQGSGEVEDYTVNFSGTTPPPNNTLSTPSNLRADSYASGFYAVSDMVSNATSYEVQLQEGSSWLTEGTSSSYYLYIPKKGNQISYTFRVRAKNATELSDWSSSLNTTLPAAGAGPNSINESFDVYPNPTSGEVNFKLPFDNKFSGENYTIEIYDSLGKLIDVIKNQQSYPTDNLKKGLYIIKLKKGKLFNSESTMLIVK